VAGLPKNSVVAGSTGIGEFCTRPLTNSIIAACSLYILVSWRCDPCELTVNRVRLAMPRLTISVYVLAMSVCILSTAAAAVSAVAIVAVAAAVLSTKFLYGKMSSRFPVAIESLAAAHADASVYCA
jgi:hypothetical protein